MEARFPITMSWVLLALLANLTGCAQLLYAKTKSGQFEGRLLVRWEEPNRFVYMPDPDRPLKFTTSDGRVLQPQLMYTDAGSIPRLFWSTPGLGPWDFAPGYIIHDWLFQEHHCQIYDWQLITFEYSANVLAEAMKTQMVSTPNTPPDPTLVWAVHTAVSSGIAKQLWDNGTCQPTPAAAPQVAPVIGVTIREIDFPR